jgi:hypothetical protein
MQTELQINYRASDQDDDLRRDLDSEPDPEP